MEYYIWILIAIAIFIMLLITIRCIANGPKTNLNPDMTGKVVIVTGSNTGIGKITALELLSRGAKVIFASRDETKTRAVIDSIHDRSIRENAFYIKLDVGSFESIRKFVEEFKATHKSCDILINNAGATFDKFELKDNIESTMMTNHIGPVCLTTLLLGSINPRGKVINVSSMAHKFVTHKDLNKLYSDEDFNKLSKSYSTLNIYYLSKLGNIYHAKYLDIVMKASNLEIKTASLHPGIVYSNLFSSSRYSRVIIKFIACFSNPFWWLISKDVYMGAQTTLHLAFVDYDDLNSGAYYSNCQVEKLREIPSDEGICKQFMKFSGDLIRNNWTVAPDEISDHFRSLNYLEN